MKKILILEDDQTRVQQFKNNLVEHRVKVVETALDAIEELTTNKYDVLYLDHDLGPGAGTGYDVACFLENNQERQPEKIIVHSFNYTGARNILSALPHALMRCGDFGRTSTL